MSPLTIAVGGFLLLLIGSVVLRAVTGSKFDIKISDIILALIPIVLWLFITGKIQEFTLGELKIVAAVSAASKSPVAPQVTRLPVEVIRVDPKRGVEQIPALIRNRTQALSFVLGSGVYDGRVVVEYLRALTQQGGLRYIVLNNSDGSLFGMADAQQTAAILQAESGPFSAVTLANWLNSGDRGQLQNLPGFVSPANALRENSDKREALQRMNALDAGTLPVVDDKGRLVGIVDRSKLTASILIDIAQRLEGGK